MIKQFAALTSNSLQPNTTFARPTQSLRQNVKITDPALDVMTDLRKISVIVVRAMTTLEKANAKMIRYGVRTLLVLDVNDKVVGLLTATDVMGEKPVRFLQEMGGTHADILVRDVMTMQRDLEVLCLEDVEKARVGDILATLKKQGRQHAMVVEKSADGQQSVRGMYSLTQIARQMGIQIKSPEVAKVLAEIEANASK